MEEKQAAASLTTPHSSENNSSSNKTSIRRITRTWMIRAVAMSIGIFMAVLFGEVALRIVGVSYPLPYQTDPFCGSRLQPQFSALFTKEGRAYVQTTRDGRRDREYTTQKSSDTFRIAVLGDSYAEALQVELDETFWSVLQRELQLCEAMKNRKLEVLNFGVSGFGTAQELQMLEHYVWDYQPDVVLVAFLTGNDISDNSHQLSANPVRPFYSIENDELKLDESFRQHPTFIAADSTWGRTKTALINRSRILQLMRETWTRSRSNTPATNQNLPTEMGLDAIYSPPKSKDWNDAWAVTERILQQMHHVTRERGAQLAVVTLTNAIQVEPITEKRQQLQKAAGLDHLFYADLRIAEFGKNNGFPVFTLAPEMQAAAERSQTYFHGFENTQLGTGHWNRAGHQIAGELLAQKMCEWLSP